MTTFLRVLLLASTVLSLLAARWAHERSQQRQQARLVTPALGLARGANPRWLPAASWCSWSALAAGCSPGRLPAAPPAAVL